MDLEGVGRKKTAATEAVLVGVVATKCCYCTCVWQLPVVPGHIIMPLVPAPNRQDSVGVETEVQSREVTCARLLYRSVAEGD